MHAFSNTAWEGIGPLRAAPELRSLDPPRGPNRLPHGRGADLARDADPGRFDGESSCDRLQRQLPHEARPRLESLHRGTRVVETVDNLVQGLRAAGAVRCRPSAFEGAEGVKYPRLMPSAGSKGLRQHRVRVFAASPGPARALHHEGDERVPTVDVDCLGSYVSGRDDCLVLVVQVSAVVVRLI